MTTLLSDIETSAINHLRDNEGDESNHVATIRVIGRLRSEIREIASGSGAPDPFMYAAAE